MGDELELEFIIQFFCHNAFVSTSISVLSVYLFLSLFFARSLSKRRGGLCSVVFDGLSQSARGKGWHML